MSRIDDEALFWVTKQASGTLCEIDRQAFEVWYKSHDRHQGAYLRAQALWNTLDKATIQSNLRPSADSEQARPSSLTPPLNARPSRRGFLIGGTMASVAAGLTALIVARQLSGQTKLITTQGEFHKAPLTDRSVVNLNSSSHVEVSMTKTLRRVVLVEGEAWFDVAKNPERPFIVEAGEVRVRAIGTAFSVRRRDKGADVLVTEGVVEAWSDKGSAEPRRITAGEKAFVADESEAIRIDTAPEEIERKLAWRDGNIVVNNDTLSDAVAEFNRYNHQKIVISDPAIRMTRLVGQYRLDRPEDFARDVQSLLNVPVHITADSIAIGRVDAAGTPETVG